MKEKRRWIVKAYFPWHPGEDILARCRTRQEARKIAQWERRHPSHGPQVKIRVEDYGAQSTF